ncbi:monoamine oxidase [Propionibacterium cyclohexanicum]|uniref:Monoamine oxidase n=1 Tax=Propionibacterium cyclohexanicum TaxID=64702 RepID=A0A1H9RVN7_9ACTN|nr:FAD-dependent oxidoreductase [Propionibacterium cyclohexanicum]SER76674.1 monoamine oxidase [Propionibacterium cyclohexanicum]
MLDCVIVGAGFAGLSVATELARRGEQLVVLEARDRVGGRVASVTLSQGEVVDMGGQWISPSHDRMLELVAAAGLTTVPANPGKLTVVRHGQIRAVEGSAMSAQYGSPFSIADLGQGLMRLRRLSDRAASDLAWSQANATWLDQTIDQWIDSNLRTPSGRRDIRAAMKAVFESSLDKTTLRQALVKVREGIDMENLIAANGDIGQVRVPGGLWQVCHGIAEGLGDRVRYNQVVSAVHQRGETVTVITADGQRHEARSAVIALPPWLAQGIEYSPSLESWRGETVKKTSPGNVIKCCLVYQRPWWRDEGLSGQMSADEGPVRVTFDVTDDPSGRGILTGFFEGGEASMLTKFSKSMRERVFKDAMVSVFGEQAARPVEYVDCDWGAEPFTKGSHGAHFAPGVWSVTGQKLAAPFGRVEFAGAEYASKFNGYVEGAVRRGAEVAASVARTLHG